MTDKPPEFQTIHKRAAEIVAKETILAYAIATELRKRIVGRTKEASKFDLLSILGYTAWNRFAEIKRRGDNDPKYLQNVTDLLAETIIVAHDILTERGR